MSKKIILSLLFFIVLHVSGHESWMQPDKFIYKRTEPINIKFLTGEQFTGSNWMDDKKRIDCMQLYFDDAVDKNLLENFGEDKGDSLQLAMIDEGTVMATLDMKDSVNEVPAVDFNQYLKANDLTDALEYREKNGDTAKDGVERYQNSMKTIFQVGDRLTYTYGEKTELPLDIVPLDHPYKKNQEDEFGLQVFFMGEKLKNSTVKVWHKLDNKVSLRDYTTDDDGEIRFPLSAEGEWMVSCVKMIRVENDKQAEWQSYCGSLTWGYY